jgi:hypothetical protein
MEILKELVMKRFGTLATLLIFLLLLLGLNGSLGNTLDSLFDNWLGRYKPVYIEKQVPTPTATPTPPTITEEEIEEDKSE